MSGPRLLPSRPPERLILPLVRGLAALHVTPTAITVAGLAGNIVAAVLIGSGELLAGGVVMLLSSALDMLDGALARETGRASPFGALFDSVVDRISESVVLFGVLVYTTGQGDREQTLLVFGALAGSLLVSYVRARTEGLGATMTAGLFTRPERVILLAVGLIFDWMRVVLWVLAVLTALTTLQRLYIGGRAVLDQSREERP